MLIIHVNMKWSKFNICRKTSQGNYVLFNYATDNVLVFLLSYMILL